MAYFAIFVDGGPVPAGAYALLPDADGCFRGTVAGGPVWIELAETSAGRVLRAAGREWVSVGWDDLGDNRMVAADGSVVTVGRVGPQPTLWGDGDPVCCSGCCFSGDTLNVWYEAGGGEAGEGDPCPCDSATYTGVLARGTITVPEGIYTGDGWSGTAVGDINNCFEVTFYIWCDPESSLWSYYLDPANPVFPNLTGTTPPLCCEPLTFSFGSYVAFLCALGFGTPMIVSAGDPALPDPCNPPSSSSCSSESCVVSVTLTGECGLELSGSTTYSIGTQMVDAVVDDPCGCVDSVTINGAPPPVEVADGDEVSVSLELFPECYATGMSPACVLAMFGMAERRGSRVRMKLRTDNLAKFWAARRLAAVAGRSVRR